MIFIDALPFIVQGIIFVLLVDIVGSIASRKYNFNYTYFAPLSLLNYMSVGYFASDSHGLKTALAASFVVGVFDATIGLWIALKLKANYRFNEEEEQIATHPVMLLFLIGVTVLFGFIGHLLT
jgi:hypothetical protein